MKFLANAIRVAREKRGWTQTELAGRLAVTQGTISFWENEREMPSLAHQLELVGLMPDILNALAIQELHLLDRVQALERIIFDGKCACKGCGCSDEGDVTAVSEKLKDKS